LDFGGNQVADISALAGLTKLINLNAQNNRLTSIVTLAKCPELQTLYLDGNQLVDVSALGGLTNLVTLGLSHNQITQVGLLAGLTNLTSLDFGGNRVADISLLAGLTNLTSLSLWGNQVASVSALAGLTNLTSLTLWGNLVANISPLSGLTNLTSLDLGGNQVANISPLAGLTNLTSLSLWNNQLADISPAAGLTKLSYLNAQGNRLTSITVLANCPELQGLYLDNNQLVDVSTLGGLTNLNNLGLSGNQITQIGPLAGLTNLTSLNLQGNQVAGISPLAGLTNLTSLNLQGNQVADISPLAGLTNLTSLNLQGNRAADISPLTGLTNLTWLNLDYNGVTSVQALANCTQLGTLYLSGNYVADINPLAGLTDLTALYLDNNWVSDISPLDGLTRLTHVELEFNYLGVSPGSPALTLIDAWLAHGATVDFQDQTAVREVVTFADPHLEAAVRAALSMPTGDIMSGDMLKLAGLSAYNLGIVNLAGLEWAANLSWLNLGQNRLTSITALANCFALQTLYLGNNELTDVGPLAGSTNLVNVDLSNNQIARVDPLAGLAKLTWLNLAWNRAPNFPVLANCPALQSLYLDGNQLVDVTALAAFKNLVNLGLSNNQIIHVDPLAGLAKLTSLNLGWNRVTSFLVLAKCPALQSLYLDGNQLVDVSALAAFKNLVNLGLSNNQITQIDPLAGLTELSYLNAQNNRLASIVALTKCPELQTLYLDGNQLVDVSALAGLTNLVNLSLSGNQITQIGPLAGLTNLTSLNLQGNQVAGISPLAGLTNLTWLDLQGNRAADISPLAGLTNLTWLNLDYNGVTSVQPLAACTRLGTLYLSGNCVTDVNPLAGLTNLTALYLDNNWLSDISPLEGLTRLTHVELEFNYLGVSPGSPALTLIDAWLAQGATVDFQDQTAVRQVVTFADSQLEAAVRAALSIPTGDIMNGNMLTLTSLSANNLGVTSLAGLEWAANLSWLNLGQNRLTSIAALANCFALQTLYLGNNELTDAGPLAGLTNLVNVDLSNNQIAQIAPLAGLTNLTSLGLGGNQVANISPLAGLTNLTSLGLGGNRVGNLSGLTELTNLVHLELYNNQVTQLGPLAGLTGLNYLDLGGNKVADISALAGLTNLTSLSLWGNQIANISPLAGLTQLSSLNVQNNRLTSLAALANCFALQNLYLDGNQLVDVSVLAGLTNLVNLSLSSNQITLIGPLVGLTKLTSLNLAWNRVTDYQALANCPALQSLYLDGIQLADVSALAAFPNLVTLGLSNNQITQTDPLAGLTKLTWLNLGNNRLASIAALANCTALQYLYLGGNQLTDVRPLAGLTSLVNLELYNNQITQIGPLAGLTDLTYLNLDGNQVTDISALGRLTNLANLGLSANQITQIGPLASCTQLGTLDLSGNYVTNVTALAGLTTLTTLNLGNNWLTDISMLGALSRLTQAQVQWNYLDVSPGSPAANVISAWVGEGVNVSFAQQYPQSDLVPHVVSSSGEPSGFTIEIASVGPGAGVDPGSIVMALDGASVAPTSIQPGTAGMTWVSFNCAPNWLASDSSHTVSIQFKNLGGVAGSSVDSVFVLPYTVVPASMAVSRVNTTEPGFRVRPYQTAADNPDDLAWTELQMAGQEGPNLADLSGADAEGFYNVPGVINFDINTSAADGHFNAPQYPDALFPGNGGAGTFTDNLSEEIITWLYFPAAGFYTMGVNSEDGFKLTTSAKPLQPNGLILGQFDGGRGAADTLFTFLIQAPGYYPFRLLYENGQGWGNCEWFTVEPDGTCVLINDPADPQALRAYRSDLEGPPSITDFKGAAFGFEITIQDGATSVNPASVQTTLNDTSISPRVTHTGLTTTVVYSPATPLALDTAYTVGLVFADDSGAYQTTNFTLTVTAPSVAGNQWPESGLDWANLGYTNDGFYTIMPDGPGGAVQNVYCLMSIAQGGWTKLTLDLANSLLNADPNTAREYLYLKDGSALYYRTPSSKLVWSWTSGQDLYGTYFYSSGTGEQSFQITPSSEHQAYGVGGSSGPGDTAKCLVYYSTCLDPANAEVQLCQDVPGIFGGACQCDVSVYIRPASTDSPFIVAQPQTQMAVLGTSAALSVEVVGASPFTYQWWFNGTSLADSGRISGSQGSTLTIANFQPADAGNYQVVVANAYGAAVSAPAALTCQVWEPGFAKVEWWFGSNDGTDSNLAQMEAGGLGPAQLIVAAPQFAAKEDNNNGGFPALHVDNSRISCWVVPPATAAYSFYVNSDDESDLFLSTDANPANMRLVAQELGWSVPLQWTSANAGPASQKCSDTFVNGAGVAPYPNGITLVQGQLYYLEDDHFDNSVGNDNTEASARLFSDPPPANGTETILKGGLIGSYFPHCAYVAFTNQPASVSGAAPFKPVTFTAGGVTDSHIGVMGNTDPWVGTNNFLVFQWMVNGTPVAGATTSTLTMEAYPWLSGAQISCRMRALGYVDASGNLLWNNSTTATLTVGANSATPAIACATYFQQNGSHYVVDLRFNKQMDPTSLLGATYSLPGLTVTSLNVFTNGGMASLQSPTSEAATVDAFSSIQLTVTGTPVFPLTVTVNGALDAWGNALVDHTASVAAGPFTDSDIGAPGDPAVPGLLWVNGPDSFTIQCEGSDIWNNADGFNFAYQLVSGDFDVVVRVKDTTHTSQWAKAGLMVRESLEPGSRDWNIIADPSAADNILAPDGSGPGAGQVEVNCRNATGGASAVWANGGDGTLPPYPDAWLRLRRSGNALTGLSSADGLQWNLVATDNPTRVGDQMPLPDSVYIGVCQSAHNNDPIPPPSWTQLEYLLTVDYANYSTAGQASYISYVYPAPGQQGVPPEAIIEVQLTDGRTLVDPQSVSLSLNGASLSATVAKQGGITTATAPPVQLASGSTNSVTLVYQEIGAAAPVTQTWQFVAAGYTMLSSTLAAPAGSGDGTKPGFRYRVAEVSYGCWNSQLNDTIEVAEQILAGLWGPAQGLSGTNIANVTDFTDNGFFDIPGVINMGTGGEFPNSAAVPGIPGVTGSSEWFGAEMLTYIEFPQAGVYTMGVESDDCFRLMLGQSTSLLGSTIYVDAPSSLSGQRIPGVPTWSWDGGFGPGFPTNAPLTAKLVYVDANSACNVPTNPAALAGNIALIDLGSCQPSYQVYAAQQAGAVAAVVINNGLGLPYAMSGPATYGGDVTIPSMMISQADGALLKAHVADPDGLAVTIGEDPSLILGQFDTQSGRSASETWFSFQITQPGLYPFRLVWDNGQGSYEVEWFTVDPLGNRILVNDTAPGALKAYRALAPAIADSIPIVISGGAPATPYPSQIAVSGLMGFINDLSVSVNGVSSSSPSGLGLLLAGPGGQSVVLMNEAGGSTPIADLNLTFSQNAANVIPQTTLSSGIFRPADYLGAGYNFPAPAPAGPYPTDLSTLTGTAPNGLWSLYAFSESAGSAGAINGGWTLRITTQPVIQGLSGLTMGVNIAASQTFTISDPSPPFSLGAVSSNPALIADKGVTFSGAGTTRKLTVYPLPNVFGTATITIFVTNANNLVANSSFNVAVQSAAPGGVGVAAGPFTNLLTGHLYFLLEPSSWTNAEATAVALGGHLATIRNAGEEQWVYNTFGTVDAIERGLWIGLYCTNLTAVSSDPSVWQNTFGWTSGELTTFTDWAPGQPSYSAGQFYVQICQSNYVQAGWSELWANSPGDTLNSGVVEIPPYLQTRIDSPAGPSQIRAGDSLRFAGHAIVLPDREPVLFTWSFGDGRTSSLGDPGLVTYRTPGTYTVTLDAQDAYGDHPFQPDSRTITVVAAANLLPDLLPTQLSLGGDFIFGEPVQITYSAVNNGDGPAAGPWVDSLYLSEEPYLDGEEILLATKEVSLTLAPGAAYTNTLTVIPTQGQEGAYYLVLSLNDFGQLLESYRLNNQTGVLLSASVPMLANGVAGTGTLTATNTDRFFRIDLPSGDNLLLSLTGPPGVSLYASYGALPTRGVYDYTAAQGGSNSELLIPGAAAGAWYILVHVDTVTGSQPFTLQATAAPLELSAVTPAVQAVNLSANLTLSGAGFVAGTTVALVAADGTAYPVASVGVDSFTSITAGLAANSAPPGLYSIRVAQAGGAAAVLANALTLVAAGQPDLKTAVVVPSQVGYHQISTCYVEYRNDGNAAMAAPLLVFTATQDGREGAFFTLDATLITEGFWTSAEPAGFSHAIQILASGSTPGLLQPGESFSVPVYYAGWQQPWDFAYPPINFSLGAVTTEDTNKIDWASFKAGMQPEQIPADAWDPIWAGFINQVGSTWGNYVAALDANASYLGRLGERVVDVGSLLAFELQQADGLGPVRSLASSVDDVVEAPALPLAFARVMPSPISQRSALGPLGRGWSHNWQLSFSVETDHTVDVLGPAGSRRVFKPDSRGQGAYFSQAGDFGVLHSFGDGSFTLLEPNGLTYAFLANGNLNYVQDANANRITAAYTGTQLVSLTHSSGQWLRLSYGANGLLEGLADSLGRQTLFTYDAAGEHLASVQDSAGLTTSYAYDEPSLALIPTHALTTITGPGGQHRYYSFDAAGRLSGTWRDGQAEPIQFGYNLGEVLATNGVGDTTSYYADYRGLLLKAVDPLGDSAHFAFDASYNLVGMTDPAGRSFTYSYDSRGNLAQIIDPLRNVASFGYTIGMNRLSAVVDANGNVTHYGYDANGDLQTATYPDGSAELWNHDVTGLTLAHTNRRGQAIYYTNDLSGRLLAKLYPSGKLLSYGYDSNGNLTNATTGDPVGMVTSTILLAYDANGRLTNAAYPGARFLRFTYDAAGRRTSVSDQLGHQTSYNYDAAGRLQSLANEHANLIARYFYDAAGRLAGQSLGNGNYTTNLFDGAGRVSQVVNYRNDGTVNSSFQYTYDERGLCESLQTLDGAWTCQYDDLGQLIGAVFASQNSAVPSQHLAYSYDAMGNRTGTSANGTANAYAANDLNEYLRAGNNTNLYDADANLLIQRSDLGSPSSTDISCAFDEEDRLVSATTASGSWTYEYDALGNLAAVVSDGQPTECVVDPLCRGEVAGEYDGAGHLIANFEYGLGLVARVDGAGSQPAYYGFSALGDTSELTDPAGAVLNAYAYDPFGLSLAKVETVSNPFQFRGQGGAMNFGNGLLYMRPRFYQGQTGRYLETDPAGLRHGLNPYTFSANEPFRRAGSPAQVWPAHSGMAVPAPAMGPGLLRAGGAPLSGSDPYTPMGGGAEAWLAAAQLNLAAWPCPTPQPKPLALPQPPNLPIILQPPLPQLTNLAATVPVGPRDPNEKICPAGYGPAGFVAPGSLMPYRIGFQNEASATAPAQQVTVTDPLSINLDWMSFQLTELGFGDHNIPVPPHTQYFETSVPMTFDGVDFVVQIQAGIDLANGQVFADFYSLDPATQLPPDVGIGFLPPEDGTGRGDGYVSFTVQAKPNLVTGTVIRNVADISFDNQPPISTDQIDPQDPSKGIDPTKGVNTIDAGPPTSSVAALPVVSTVAQIPVAWSGADVANGSGIAWFDIYVSDNSGAFTVWLSRTTGTSALFQGVLGHTYAFYSVATDHVGNVQPTPAAPWATTTVNLITGQPADQPGAAGGSASFSVVAGGATPLAYQWLFKGTPLPGATSSTLILTDLQIESAGAYAVSVSDQLGSILSSNALLTIHLAPVALGAQRDAAVSLSVAKLLAASRPHATSALSLTAFSATSTNGGSVALAGAQLTYTPPVDYVGQDAFSYTVSDSQGISASGVVLITIAPPDNLPPNNTISTPQRTGDTIVFEYVGVPGRSYVLQAATAVTGPWSNLSPQPVVADSTGLIRFSVTIPAGSSMGYYRIRAATNP
jgi:RHS repeat-associated protein